MKKFITLCFLMALVCLKTWGQATNYSFATGTGNTLTAMTGATSLIASGVDEALAGAALPFNFTFAGTTYNANTTFRVSSNGFLTFASTTDPQYINSLTSSTVYPIITPLWDDFTTGSNGGVSYIVTGTTGSRKLTIQWQVNNYVSGSNSTGSPVSKTFQLWLFEGTNVIQFVYGSFNSAPPSASVGIASSSSSFQSISISSNSVSTQSPDDGNNAIPVSGSGYTFTPIRNWIGYGAGGTSSQTDFNTATNWSPNGAPSANDNLVMNITVTNVSPTITLSSSSTVINSLTVNTSQSGGSLNSRTFILSTNNKTFTITNALTFTSAATGGGDHNANFNVTGGTTTVGSISTNTLNSNASNGSSTYALLFNISSGATLNDNGNLTAAQTDGSGNGDYITAFNNLGTFTIQGNTLANSNGFGGEVQFNVGNSPAITNFNGNVVFDDGTTESTDAIYIGSTAAVGSNTTGTMNFKGNVSIGAQAGSLANNIHGKTVFDAATTQTVTVNSSLGMYFPSVVIGSTNSPTVVLAGTSNAQISSSAPTPLSLSINNTSILDLAANTLNVSNSVTSGIAIASGAKLKLKASIGGQSGSNFPLNFSTYSFNSNSTVEYYGSGTQTIFATPVYGHLTLTSSSTKSAGGALTVNGNLTINTGSILDVTTSNFSVGVAGNWINSGSFTQRSGTVTFNGSSIQSLSGATNFYNLIFNDSPGATLLANQTVNNVLTLTNGIVTTNANIFTVSNTAVTAVSGGSTTAFVNGPLVRTLPKALVTSANVYSFPVGSGTTYLPFSTTSLTTNASISPSLQIQAFTGSAGGTGDGTTLAANGSLSTTEYWFSAAQNISNGIVSITRQTAVSPYTVIARSNTKNGTYASKGGTPSGTSINNSTNTADFASQYYVMAQAPAFAISSVLNPTSVSACFGTASSNMTLSVSGSALISGITVTPPTGFEASLSTGSGFANSVVVGGSGTLVSTPVYVRLKSSDAVGSYSGNISLSSSGVTPSQTASIATSTVKTSPTASITPSSGSACEGTGVAINITGTAGASVGYNLNSGTTQNVTLPISSFNSPTNAGSYTYTLTSVSLNGCVGTFSTNTSTITIQSLPAVGAIAVNDPHVQTGNTLQLSDATSGGAWSSNSGTTSVNTSGLVSAGTAEGTPTITYTVTDNTALHCKNSASQTIRVYNPDYITKASGNFSTAATWEIDRDDNTFVTSVPVPSGTNYTSIRVQNALTLDQDFQVRSGTNLSLITGGTMDISPNKTFSSLGAVDFGGQAVTVKSNASGTGAIGQMSSSILNATNVTAERYIGSTAFASGRRAWRLLTAPVTGITINNAWQEGAVSTSNPPLDPNPGFGTLITGYVQQDANTAFSHGYDFWTAIANSSSSIRYYAGGTPSGTWNNLPGNGLKNLDINSYPAYLLFVRGNRSTLNGTNSFSTTTLRAKGTLKQGSFSTSTSGTNGYTLVGNPYASPIDFEQIYTTNSSVIKPLFFVWNSQNGTYGSYTLVQRNGANDYNIVPNIINGGTGNTSTNAQYIVSGQGFFVQPLTSTGGSLVINDNAKTSTASVGINPYRISSSTEKRLYVNLNLKDSDTSSTLADGILARYDASYDSSINEDDVLKQANLNENFGIEHSTTDLMVEARPEVQKTDTIQLKLWNVAYRQYQVQAKAENFSSSPTLHAFLEDSYLQTKQEISLSGSVTTVDFTVNTDARSYAQNRFRIVFQNDAAVLPVTLTSVKAAPANGGMNVNWTVTNETNIKQYTIERSIDGGATYTAVATQTAKNNPSAAITQYNGFDALPKAGDNLYRIRIQDNSGVTTYSSVVKVSFGQADQHPVITMYPNPVRGNGTVQVQLSNQPAGAYLLSLYSNGGQVVYQKKITISATNLTQTETIALNGTLAQGSYAAKITDSKGAIVFSDKLIVAR